MTNHDRRTRRINRQIALLETVRGMDMDVEYMYLRGNGDGGLTFDIRYGSPSNAPGQSRADIIKKCADSFCGRYFHIKKWDVQHFSVGKKSQPTTETYISLVMAEVA